LLRTQVAEWEECFVRVAVRKIGSGWRWVVERSEDEITAGGYGESLSTGDGSKRELHGITIPYMCGMADAGEKWWERVRRNPKKSGEISQAAFLLKATMMGFKVALPWGDSERWDFVVWGCEGERVLRVQVKGTGRLHLGGYEVQPVHSSRRNGKKRYTKKEIDVIAAHVQPVDAWYLIPMEAVGRAKSLRLYPEGGSSKRREHDWEPWLSAWDVLGNR
jgi:hypothetical protein